MGTAVTVGLPFARTPVEYLEQAVRSVFAQTHADWELVLIADGSHPELEDRISQIHDSRVRLLTDEHNVGLAARLNQVALESSHDVLLRMDGDDLMHPLRIATTLEALDRFDAEVVGGRAYAVDAETRLLGLFREGGLPSDHAGFLRSNAFTHPTVAGTRRWFLDNPYDESLRRSEDKDLWLRAAAHTRFAKVPEPVLFYRLTDLGPAKQAQDAQHDRMLLRRHGPALVGSGDTAVRVVTSHVKQRTFATLARCGGEPLIVRRKVEVLDAHARTAAQHALRVAMTTRVPGWTA